MRNAAVALALLAGSACGSSPNNNNTTDGNPNGGDGGSGSGQHDAGSGSNTPPSDRTVFVIVMENESSSAIYNSGAAPYINNTIKPESAWATMFMDELSAIEPSEPHYIWMEAGTTQFSDHTFTLSDADPSAGNSTNSTAHLVTQLKTAGHEWMSYQEGLPAGCPVSSSGFYAAKHDPFVFFTDVAGSPPSASNTYCSAHHKAYTSFASDLAGGTMPSYVFITPNLCNDMHGASGCPSGSDITRGDTWLSNELPRIVTYAMAHDSVIYVIWDEGSTTQTIPFFAIGPHVKTGMTTAVYSHSALLKSVEKQLGVPVLATVSASADFAPMFDTGYFP